MLPKNIQASPWSAAAWRRFAIPFFVLLVVSSTHGEVSRKQAQKLISRAAGFNLPSSAVRVNSVNTTAADSAEVNAELQLVFRLVQNAEGVWSIREIRTGQDLWEDVAVIASAAKLEIPNAECTNPRSTLLTATRTRCLIANLFGIALPSDAVRIKEFSPFGLPIGTETSATAVAFVRADFCLHKESKTWTVSGIKTGSREWIDVSGIADAMNAVKRAQATEEMKKIASALEMYKKDRGYYVSSDNHSVLIDHISPRYLAKVIRLDPWHRPYRYQGEAQHFTLRSVGPDGKPDTADDLTVSSSSPSGATK